MLHLKLQRTCIQFPTEKACLKVLHFKRLGVVSFDLAWTEGVDCEEDYDSEEDSDWEPAEYEDGADCKN